MATSKKPAAKKTTAKSTPAKAAVTKKAPVAKSVPKKAAAKTSTAKATATKTSKTGYKSFRVSQSDTPFTSMRITRQTIYWIILVGFIIFVQLWILKLHIEVASLLETQQTELRNDI